MSAAWGQFSPFLVEETGGAQHNPTVSGTVVVWMEFIDGDFAVRGKDLATGNTFLIDEPNATEIGPVTDGKLVVWGDNRAGNYDVFARDLATGDERTLVEDPNNQGQSALGGNFVAWMDTRNSPSGVPPEFTNLDIYAVDLRSGQEFPVCTLGRDQLNPAVSGNIIVWQDHRAEFPGFYPQWGRIYGYDVTTGREFLIAASSDGMDQVKPAISGNIVVWADLHNGGDIWGYDLDSNTPFPIHVGPYGQKDVDIDGRYVVWEDWRNGTDTDIWGYDLLTGKEFPIYRGPGNQGDPHVSGNLVVWDFPFPGPGDQDRVWGAYIPEPGALLLFAALGPVILRPRRTC
jgi:beta propeller repeat protein